MRIESGEKTRGKKESIYEEEELLESYEKEERRVERLKEEIRNVKTEAQITNREKKKRKVNADIKIEEWENYFFPILEEDKEEVREPNECRNLSTDQERALDN